MLMLVVVISYRLDAIASIYTIWLSILFGVSRGTKYRIWPIFQWFIVALIVLQYVLVVDLPPLLCIGTLLKWYSGTRKTRQNSIVPNS